MVYQVITVCLEYELPAVHVHAIKVQCIPGRILAVLS